MNHWHITEKDCGTGTLRLVRGDIARTPADAVVNAANSALSPGSGVCGAIHHAGGPAIAAACREIGGCATGDAVATTAGDLPARHVIHAVAPIWQGGNAGELNLLATAYRRSLEVAEQLEDSTVAFPSLGTGVYGNPVVRAAPVALSAVCKFVQHSLVVRHVTFVLFSDADLHVYGRALSELA